MTLKHMGSTSSYPGIAKPDADAPKSENPSGGGDLHYSRNGHGRVTIVRAAGNRQPVEKKTRRNPHGSRSRLIRPFA